MINRFSNNPDKSDRAHDSGLVQKLRNTKRAIALVAIGLVLPAYSFNESKVSATEPENLIAQANNAQTQPRQQNVPNQEARPTIEEQRRDNVTTEDITDNLNAYVGRTVTVRGKIVARRGTNAFLITDEDFLGSEEILVVNTSNQPLRLPEDGIQVQATGVVRNVPLKQIAQQYNLDLADWFVKYRDKPVIVAQSVAPAPEPEEVTENPSLYYGRRLAVPADVQNVYNPTAFILGDGLLALVANPKQGYQPSAVNQGEKVVATGVLRPFVVADLEREYGFKLEPGLRSQLVAEYARKPVLIVDRVYPSAVPEATRNETKAPSAAAPQTNVTPQPNTAQAPQTNVTPQPNTAQAPQQRENVTSEEVVNKTEALIGKTVTIRGEYIEKIGEYAFTIADEQFLGVEPILVVNVSGAPLQIPSDDVKVQATGEVRKFTLAEIAKKYNMNFDRATYALYENDPVIIAESVAPAPEPEKITEEPKQYIGKRVAVPGEVQNILSPVAFTISDNLLVLNLNPKQKIEKVNQGEKVVVTGVTRRLVIAEIERDYNMTLDSGLRRQLEADYVDKPVVIADTVRPSAVEQ